MKCEAHGEDEDTCNACLNDDIRSALVEWNANTLSEALAELEASNEEVRRAAQAYDLMVRRLLRRYGK